MLDDDFSKSVMVALLPTTNDWCKIELPHLTLVYAGELPDLKPSVFNELSKVASDISATSSPLTLKIVGTKVFGDVSKVDVLEIAPSPQLLLMRKQLEEWDASTFPFSPHCTIGPEDSAPEELPLTLTFDRILVGWGKEYLTFWLKEVADATSD